MFPRNLTLADGEPLLRRWRCITRAVPAPNNSCTLALAMVAKKLGVFAFRGLSLLMNYSSSISVRNVCEPSFGDALTCSAVLEWVIPNGWTECITEESQQSFQMGMRSVLIPVAMTDMSLFTAVMYVSARRYSLISNNTAEAEKYHKLMIHYLLLCLQKIKVIINMESYPTDASMALVLCMATEAVCTIAISQQMSSPSRLGSLHAKSAC